MTIDGTMREGVDGLIDLWKEKLAEADLFPKWTVERALKRELADLSKARDDLARLRGEIDEAQARAAMHESRAAACQRMLDYWR